MKKLLAAVFIILAIVAVVRADDVNLTVPLEVDVSRVHFSELTFSPAATVTNVSTEWVETNSVAEIGRASCRERVYRSV